MLHTTVPLADAVGKHISDLCPFSIARDNQQNHCAHFVSHMLGYDFGHTCKTFTWTDKQREEPGANLRVNEVFNRCRLRGLWSERPLHLQGCLIFVTHTSNVVELGHQLEMRDSRWKHIGIHLGGTVWHYSNTGRRVVSETVSAFNERFSRAYQTSGKTVEFYFGEFI
jgi:hypothetical protein